jgi:hypothetical protein
MSAAQLLALFDQQVRGTTADRAPRTWQVVRDGPVLRASTPFQGLVFAPDLAGVSVADLDAVIARVRDFFAARGERVVWKTYGHDRADLPERLALAGFAPGRQETVVMGSAADLTGVGAPPDGVTIEVATSPEDLRGIAAMTSEVWNGDFSWVAEDLAARLASSPGTVTILTAKAGGRIVSAAWLIVMPGGEVGVLLGGSTLPSWRRQGIYRALVVRRARAAVEQGLRYLVVEASDDSRPILEHLGLRPVTTAVPYVWQPPTA